MERIKCVLVVDDDHAANFITKTVIDKTNCSEEILVALNGREALDIVEKRCQKESAQPCPQLILLDVKMPVMDGFEFLRNFEKIPMEGGQRPLVIMLSTSTNPKDLQLAQQFKIGEFINKPLKVDQMERLLNKYFKTDENSAVQELN